MINKILKNIIIIIGIISCLAVFALNIFYSGDLQNTFSEKVIVGRYSIVNLLITIAIVLGIILISKILNAIKINKKIKILIFAILLLIYVIFQVKWIHVRKVMPSRDPMRIYTLAIELYNGNWEAMKHYQYFELYPHQLVLVSIILAVFKLFNTTSANLLQYFNVGANVLTVLAITLITKQLSKSYKINSIVTTLLIFTFFTLPLLSVFVYGDIISIPMCLFAIFFIMKYSMENKKRYAIISSLFMSIAYMFRMNSLIFFIAIVIYIILDMLKLKEKTSKDILKKILILAIFVIISLVPQTTIKIIMKNRLELDPNNEFPLNGFICMGMEESLHSNGWYSNSGAWSWDDIQSAEGKYSERIKERIQYFVQNPSYFLEFYKMKLASMWTENTYTAIWHNQSINIGLYPEVKVNVPYARQIDKIIADEQQNLIIYQKALILLIFGSTVFVLAKYRKNISNEVLLLVVTFIGGFTFHILWEAKSRYIISYIVVLIPIVSIAIENIRLSEKINEKFKNSFLFKDI